MLQTLDGVNANGVEVVSVVLSIDPENFDTSIRSFANTNGFDQAGIDCVVQGNEREEVREGFSYYTGLPSTRIPSSSSRRLFLVLNGVTGSPSHAPLELLYSEHGYGSSDKDTVLGLINSIMPGDGGGGPGGLTFAAWVAENGLPEDTSVSGDADDDGLANGIEFFLDRSPGTLDIQPLTIARVNESQVSISYTMGQNRVGATASLEGSRDGIAWETLDVPEEDWVVIPGEGRDAAKITLPLSEGQLLRLTVSVE